MIDTPTPRGLHEFVAERVITRYAHSGIHAADLGTGPGAMAARLHALGCDVVAVDRDPVAFKADLPFVSLDFNRQDFASQLGSGSFDLLTAIEVIEHLESPINFLRNISQLLAPNGVAVLTTPNVDCLPARVKFFLTGKVRTMDERGDPTHISPIFMELLRRKYLPIASMKLREHLVFPPNGYQLTRKSTAWAFRLACALLPGDVLLGDNHIIVLQAAS
jgi:2-polyprenyl-3-methyl-5-hydroxy-6-metoxy-1,4-benzoquinol methylase